MLSYFNGDAIMSYHMLLYRTRYFYIVAGVLLYRSSDAVPLIGPHAENCKIEIVIFMINW